MPVDVELDGLSITDLAHEVVKASVLRRVTRSNSTVDLRARVRRRSTWVGIPKGLPISVDVSSEAGLVGCVSWRGLAILAPQTIRRLSVDEA